MTIKTIRLAVAVAVGLSFASIHPATAGYQTHHKPKSTFTPMMRGTAPPAVSLQVKPVTRAAVKPKFKSQFRKSAKPSLKPTFKPSLKQQQVRTSAKRQPKIDRKSLHRQAVPLRP